jgi:hypothetical protein
MRPSGLDVPANRASFSLGYVSHEVPTFEGTRNPERLDILGYDQASGALVAVELKRREAGRVELENLFLQAWEHRTWLEENKRAVKFLFEGPRGRRINTRKRARLVLGIGGDSVPDLFWQLRDNAQKSDPHLEIDFVRARFASTGPVLEPMHTPTTSP